MAAPTHGRRAEKLQDFNTKLASVKSEPQDQHRSNYPDFAGMERAAAEDLARRRQEAAARNKAEVEKSHVPKTAADYRGQGSVRLHKAAKNEATSSSQLSVPLNDEVPYYTKAAQDGKRLGKKSCDVCLIETNHRITGVGTLFSSEHCKTFTGWKPGCF